MQQADTLATEIAYVYVPADTSVPLQERAFRPPRDALGDALLEHLKPSFAKGQDQSVDVELLKQEGLATTLAGSADVPTVSDATLQQVASEANVETFSLVHPTPTNNFTGINIYLDEGTLSGARSFASADVVSVICPLFSCHCCFATFACHATMLFIVGMLKRLPLNKRATDFAARAGFNPAPIFYGDVFLGRLQQKPTLRNVSFQLGIDTANDAAWLKSAVTDNLDYQKELNAMTGQRNTQAGVAGSDGQAKEEDGYSWTQTEGELEVIVRLPADATSKQIKVKFHPLSLQVLHQADPLVNLSLFERIDVDSCTWTMESEAPDAKKLVVTMEKLEEAYWPRIRD
jgi:hypothetical protein